MLNRLRPMKYLPAYLIVILGVAVSACSTPRYASTTEYDDVYYSSSDQTEPLAVEESSDRSNDPYDSDAYAERPPVDNYYDTYYDDDDFVFSRRLRRFHQPANRSFRYYDPFYSNDLYYVMGTPAWNRWNHQYGWYNWNSPRFAAPYDPFGTRWSIGWSSFNQPFYGWNSWNNSYYNPYVSAYYGYDPFFGGWNGGWGNYNDPYFYGAGFGGPAYCPPGFYNRPTVIVANGGGGGSNNITPVTRRRGASPSSRSQTTLRSRNSSSQPNRSNPTVAQEATPTGRDTRNARNQAYLQPRQPVRQATPSEVQRTVRETRASVPRRSTPNRSRNTGVDRNSPRRSSPSINSGRNRAPVRTSPSRNTSPRRSYDPPRSSPSRRSAPSIRRSTGGNNSGSRNSSRSSPRRRRDN